MLIFMRRFKDYHLICLSFRNRGVNTCKPRTWTGLQYSSVSDSMRGETGVILRSYQIPGTWHTSCIHTSSRATGLFGTKAVHLPKHDKEKGDLVYVGTLADKVRMVKSFSLATSIVALALQPAIYNETSSLPFALQMVVGGGLAFFIFLTPVLLHIITKRYVINMYYNKDTAEFTAQTLNLLVRPRSTVFRPTQVSVPEVPGLFTTVKVNGKPLFLDPTLFLSRDAYIRLMGYDKPMDWQVPSDNKITEGSQTPANKQLD